jgi:4-hydroxybenzoate polyprenyltransferase
MDTDARTIAGNKLIQNLMRYVKFGKLYSIPLVLVSGLFTTLLANGEFPDLGRFVIYCVLINVGYTGALAIDDIFDYASDIANDRQEKPLIAGTVTKREVFAFGVVILLATACSFWLVFGIGVLLVYLFMFVYLIVFCYVGNHVKLPLITQIATVTATNLVSVVLPFVAFAKPGTLMVVLYVAGVVWDFCHDCPSSIKHMKGDKISGQRTAAVDLGPKGAAQLSLFLRPIWVLLGVWIASLHMGFSAYLVMFAAVVWGTYSSIQLIRDPSIKQATKTYSNLTLEFLFITLGFVLDTILGHPQIIR